MTLPMLVPTRVLAASLDILKDAGHARRECVVLWLGRREIAETTVVEAYRPEQVAAEDFFQLPRSSIAALFDVLRSRGLMVAAQVHTHPAQAFHSAADDQWAIVRHIDALSLVLPYFARDVGVSSFFAEAAVFRLSSENDWCQVPRADVARYVRGVP
jgi:proteasome lid subunit RPN8/RPN11